VAQLSCHGELSKKNLSGGTFFLNGQLIGIEGSSRASCRAAGGPDEGLRGSLRKLTSLSKQGRGYCSEYITRGVILFGLEGITLLSERADAIVVETPKFVKRFVSLGALSRKDSASTHSDIAIPTDPLAGARLKLRMNKKPVAQVGSPE
jgi:hypothetical protein